MHGDGTNFIQLGHIRYDLWVEAIGDPGNDKPNL